jgi:hypothetical protein
MAQGGVEAGLGETDRQRGDSYAAAGESMEKLAEAPTSDA